MRPSNLNVCQSFALCVGLLLAGCGAPADTTEPGAFESSEARQLQAPTLQSAVAALAPEEALGVEARRSTPMRERSANFESFIADDPEADGSLSEDEIRARLSLAGFRQLSASSALTLQGARRSVTLSELEKRELELHLDLYGIPRHEVVFTGRGISWRELWLDSDEVP